MKKFWKILLIAFATISLFILAIVFLCTIAYHFKRKKAEKDLIEYSKICDSIIIINEMPEIGFTGFGQKEINILKFEVKRGGKIVKDTLLKNKFSYISGDKIYRRVKIPFLEFLKTDTIIITIKNNLKFYISDFHHGTGLHYGMFGPVDGYECGLNENFNINGKDCNCISREMAVIESDRNNRIKIVNATDEKEVKIISKNSKITYEMAEKIFVNNRMNKQWFSQLFYGIDIEKKNVFYIFGEEREDKNGKKDIIRINANNGDYRRYSNYPFD